MMKKHSNQWENFHVRNILSVIYLVILKQSFFEQKDVTKEVE